MSAPNNQLRSLQELYSASDECCEKSQILRALSQEYRKQVQMLKFYSDKHIQRSQSLRAYSCELIHKSHQQCQTHSDKGFGKIKPLPVARAAHQQMIDKLPDPNEHFLMLMQSQSDLDGCLALINELQSDTGARLAGLEQLQSNLDKHLAIVNDLMKDSKGCESTSDVSSESRDEAQLKTPLDKMHGLINTFVTGWSEGDEFAACDPL